MKDKDINNKNRNTILTKIILINAVILLIMLALFYPRFENEADIVMQALLYGVGADGLSNAHILFSNIILGKVIQGLLMLAPNIPWYVIAHYFFAFVALCTICYVTVKRNNTRTGSFIAILILLFMGYDCYITPNYLKTATLLAVAVLYYVVFCIEENRLRILNIIFVFGLALLGILVSWKAFLFAVLVGGGLSFCYIERKYHQKKKLLLYVGIVAVILCAGIVLDKVDEGFYKSGDFKYRDDFETIFSYGIPDNINGSIQEQLGLEDEDAVRAISQGCFFNGNTQQYELFHKYVRSDREYSIDKLNRYIKHVPLQLLNIGMFYLIALLIFIYFVCCKDKNKRDIAYASVFVLLVGFICYANNMLLYKWNYKAIIILFMLFLLLEIQNAECTRFNDLIVFAVLLSIILYSNFSHLILRGTATGDMMERINTMNEKVINLVDINRYLQGFSVFKVYSKDIVSVDNLYFVNGVYTMFDSFDEATNTGEWEPEYIVYVEEDDADSDEVDADNVDIDEVESESDNNEGETIENIYPEVQSGNYVWLYNVRGISANSMMQ